MKRIVKVGLEVRNLEALKSHWGWSPSCTYSKEDADRIAAGLEVGDIGCIAEAVTELVDMVLPASTGITVLMGQGSEE